MNITWCNVKDKLPDSDRVVVALAPSGYITYPYSFFAATYNPNYKGWVNIQNQRITDYGEDVAYWAEVGQFNVPPDKVNLDELEYKWNM